MKFNDILHRDEQFRYMLLDRMRTDCEYFLGNGNRLAKNLWALDEVDHIACMKALWNSFGENGKPVWLSYEKILDYEKQMCPKAILVEMDYKASYGRFALTPDEFEKIFPDTFKTFGPIEESNSDTLKPMVHIWFAPCVVGDSTWERHFTNMEWGLPESDIDAGNSAYVDFSSMNSLLKYVPQEAVVQFIEETVKDVVERRDWTMPKYVESEYGNYGEYENECYDIGHERRSEICGAVIALLHENNAIAKDDESYHEIIDEEVWDQITNCIIRSMDKDVPTVIASLAPGQKYLELDTEKTIELTEKVASDIWNFRVYDADHNYLYDTSGTETRLAKDVVAGYIVTKAEVTRAEEKKPSLADRINDANERSALMGSALRAPEKEDIQK